MVDALEVTLVLSGVDMERLGVYSNPGTSKDTKFLKQFEEEMRKRNEQALNSIARRIRTDREGLLGKTIAKADRGLLPSRIIYGIDGFGNAGYVVLFVKPER